MDVVRRVPQLLPADPTRARAVWMGAQQIRIALAGIILVTVLPFAPWLSALIFDEADWAGALRLIAFGAAAELIFRGHLSDYQSRERFDRFLALELMLQSTRILCVAGLIIGGALSAESFLAGYAASTTLVVLVALTWAGRARRALWQLAPGELVETLKYVRWIAPAMVLSALVERLDVFLLMSFRGPETSGLYGALLPLILIPEVVVGFAIGVLQPRIADFHARGLLSRFWRQISLVFVPLAVLGAGVVWIFAETIIVLTIGPAYLASADVLRVLFLAVMIWFAIAPVALSFVVMVLPRATLVITLFQAATALGAGTVLIGNYGAIGAAATVLVTRSVTAAMIFAAAIWLLRGTASESPVTS